MNIFPGPNFVSPEWSCYLNRGVSKERFHCILSKMLCNRVRDRTLGRSLPVLEVTECSGKKKTCISKLREIFKTFNVTGGRHGHRTVIH